MSRIPQKNPKTTPGTTLPTSPLRFYNPLSYPAHTNLSPLLPICTMFRHPQFVQKFGSFWPKKILPVTPTLPTAPKTLPTIQTSQKYPFHTIFKSLNTKTPKSFKAFSPRPLLSTTLSLRNLTTHSSTPLSTPLISNLHKTIQKTQLNTSTKRFFALFGSPDRITIPGTIIPVSPWKRLRKVLLFFLLFGIFFAGGAITLILHLTDHLEQLMRFNIRFRGQSDIHYYATASRVNHRFNPQFTGDKVSDIKLLQAKLIRDIYKVYLATDPMERNIDLINRYLGDKKVLALRDMAAKDPELAREISNEMLLETQYSMSISRDIIRAILQNLLSIYFQATYIAPNHRQSVDYLHKQFEDLRELEQSLQPMVEFTNASLDALVEGSVATPYQDPKKVPVFEPNVVDRSLFARPL